MGDASGTSDRQRQAPAQDPARDSPSCLAFLLRLALVFPPTFAGFNLFLFAVWFYWPVDPFLVILCAPVFVVLFAFRLGRLVGFRRGRRSYPLTFPPLTRLTTILELAFWWAFVGALYIHLNRTFGFKLNNEDGDLLVIPVGYGAYFAAAAVGAAALGIASFPLRELAQDLVRFRNDVRRLLAVALIVLGLDLAFAVLYRIVSLYDENAFQPRIASFATAFLLSTNTISVIGPSQPAPASGLVQFGVAVETLIGLLVLAALLAFVIATFGSYRAADNEVRPR